MKKKQRLAAMALLLGTLLGPGCVTIKEMCFKERAPKGTPCQIVVRWEPEVARAPDPTRNGAMIPGFAGRIYLFGPTIDFPMGCDGSIGVELFDATGGASPKEPMETWQIDPATAERLCVKDAIGWGYTMFLPWSSMKPEVREVRLRVKFASTKGQVLFNDSGVVKLHTTPVALGPKGNVPVPTTPAQTQPGSSPLPAPTPVPSLPAPRPAMQGAALKGSGR